MNNNIIPNNLKESFAKYLIVDDQKLLILKTTNTFNIKNYNELELVINLEKTNNFRFVNKFHETANDILTINGIYCSCAETLQQRKLRKKKICGYIEPKNMIL